MKTKPIPTLAGALMMLALVTEARAQGADVYWHIDPGVKTCSMKVDPSQTQAQWKTFVRQAGAITTFKSLASAEPLGTMNFSVGIDQGRTPVDQRNPAWINTFVHPDAECPLGDAISFPSLRARMGVSDRMDIGGYWTTAPNANYGMVGGEVRYLVSKESEDLPAASVRGSFTVLTGVPDFDMSIYSVELSASKKVAMFNPYVGVRGNLANGTTTTSKVRLAAERDFFAQGYAGVSYSFWVMSLAAEYNVSTVNTLAVAVEFNF